MNFIMRIILFIVYIERMLHHDGAPQGIICIREVDHDRIAHFLDKGPSMLLDDRDGDRMVFSEHLPAFDIAMCFKIFCGAHDIRKKHGNVVHRGIRMCLDQGSKEIFKGFVV